VVLTLIRVRAAMFRNRADRAGRAGLMALAALVLISAGGTLALGAVPYAHEGAGADVVALALAAWVGGRVAQAALTGGDDALRPELFRLLPIPRRRLAWALLVAGVADASLALPAVAFGAMVALGVRAGPLATVVGVVALVLLLGLTSVLSTLAGGLLAPGARRGHDAGTIALALIISLVAVAGTLLPALASVLTSRSSPALSLAVRVPPSGWGPLAVDAAGHGRPLTAAGALLGLLALTALAALAWPAVLGRALEGAGAPARAGGAARRARLLPATPTGAVTAKELRMWGRDPVRLTCLLIAVVVGAASCAIPRVTAGTDVLLPFAGALTVVIAGGCACNLYATDGPGLWATVMAPRSARADVRGRQAAWLIVVAPYAVALTVVLTAASGARWAWPAVLALLPALIGGAAGLAAYGSLVSVQPADAAGNPTPAWSLKVHIALPVVALTAAPPGLALAAGAGLGDGAITWAAVPIGVATGLALGLGLGRRAERRLGRDPARVLARLARANR
jgi:ABC-2 type transport system permease protein